MNEQELDTEIRQIAIQLAESAPTAPSAADLGLGGSVQSYTDASNNVHTLDNKRSRRNMLGGLAAAAALTAGGVVTLNAASDSDVDTSSPAAAVEEFIGAVADEDVIGLMATMDPGERDMLQLTFTDVIAELDRLEVLDGADLSGVQGFDMEVLDLVVEPRRLTDSMYAVRIAGGTFTSTTDSTQFAIGQGVVRAADGYSDLDGDLAQFASELDETVLDIQDILDENDFEFVVTNNDGWHVDLDQTLWHAVQKDSGWDAPDYAGGGIVPQGADSPEAAALAYMQAQTVFNMRNMLQLADPVELDGTLLHGEQLIRALAEEDMWLSGPGSTFASSDISVDGDGERRTVNFNAYEVLIVDGDGMNNGDETFGYSFDGTCVTTSDSSQTSDSAPDPVCPSDLSGSETGFLDALVTSINVVERDGKWFVSGIGTIHDSWMNGLRAFDTIEGDNDAFRLLQTIYSPPLLPGFGAVRVLFLGFESESSVSFERASSPEPTEYFDGESEFDNDPVNLCFNELGFAPEETPEQARAAGERLGLCLSETGMDSRQVTEQVGYRSCQSAFMVFDERQQEPTPEELVVAYGAQADCLESYGVSGVYRPSVDELRAEQACESVYDEFFSEESGQYDDDQYEAVDQAYQECIEEQTAG